MIDSCKCYRQHLKVFAAFDDFSIQWQVCNHNNVRILSTFDQAFCVSYFGLVGFELEGKKFGVIGTGAIGTRVAKIAQAFGCEVYAYSRTVKDLPRIQFVGLEELLYNCDIISLHVPLNESTKGLIGKDEIALMKPDAVLINTARGPIVDSEALAEALNNGKIAGAAVDVFENEPPVSKDHPLLHAKNLIATPHVAFATKEALVKRAIIDFDNVKCWMEGKPVNVMN